MPKAQTRTVPVAFGGKTALLCKSDTLSKKQMDLLQPNKKNKQYLHSCEQRSRDEMINTHCFCASAYRADGSLQMTIVTTRSPHSLLQIAAGGQLSS